MENQEKVQYNRLLFVEDVLREIKRMVDEEYNDGTMYDDCVVSALDKLTEFIKNPPKNETHKLGWVAKDSDDIVRFCSVEPVKDREDWMAEDEFYWMVPGGASIVCDLGFNKDLIVDKDHPRKAELVIKITE